MSACIGEPFMMTWKGFFYMYSAFWYQTVWLRLVEIPKAVLRQAAWFAMILYGQWINRCMWRDKIMLDLCKGPSYACEGHSCINFQKKWKIWLESLMKIFIALLLFNLWLKVRRSQLKGVRTRKCLKFHNLNGFFYRFEWNNFFQTYKKSRGEPKIHIWVMLTFLNRPF